MDLKDADNYLKVLDIDDYKKLAISYFNPIPKLGEWEIVLLDQTNRSADLLTPHNFQELLKWKIYYTGL
jgi:hypothetical protein